MAAPAEDKGVVSADQLVLLLSSVAIRAPVALQEGLLQGLVAPYTPLSHQTSLPGPGHVGRMPVRRETESVLCQALDMGAMKVAMR